MKWEKVSEGNVSETEYLNNLKMGGFFGNLKAELLNTAFVIREVKNLQESSTMYAYNLGI